MESLEQKININQYQCSLCSEHLSFENFEQFAFPWTHALEHFPVVRVNLSPLRLFVRQSRLRVHEVASVPILTMSFFKKCIARFCFIRIICIVVYSQLLRPVSELTLLSVRAEPFLSEVFAQAALDLWLWILSMIVLAQWEGEVFRVSKVEILLTLRGGLRLVIGQTSEGLGKVGVSVNHVCKCNFIKIDYNQLGLGI